MDKHRSAKLDNMLEKNVLVIFFDHSCDIGRLEWDKIRSRYKVADTLFRKSHVRKIVKLEATNDTTDRIIKAYKTISQYCESQYPDCSNCCFARWSDDGTNDYCEFDHNPCPIEWTEVKK